MNMFDVDFCQNTVQALNINIMYIYIYMYMLFFMLQNAFVIHAVPARRGVHTRNNVLDRSSSIDRVER